LGKKIVLTRGGEIGQVNKASDVPKMRSTKRVCVDSGTDLNLPSEVLEVGTFKIVVGLLQSTKVVVDECGSDSIGELHRRKEAAVV
jgi:hypothetical protein